MARRFSTEDKSKAMADNPSGPPHLRMRAPDFDPSELIKDNMFTLVGRLTNPREQKMSAVLPYLAKTWNVVDSASGSDLGNGCFQFRLNSEKEVQEILSNRPYRYGRWMIIVQRWEPIISPSFPAQIPFWISLRGIPLHYWHDKVVRNIVLELGELETYEVTRFAARIRVIVDGLKPLIVEAAMDFDTGEESIIFLDYEKLGNHCSICFKLSHLQSQCLERPAPITISTTESLSQTHNNRQIPPTSPPRSFKEAMILTASHYRPFNQRVDRHGNPFANRVSSTSLRPQGSRNKITPALNQPRHSPEREKTPVSNQVEEVYTSPLYTRQRLNRSADHITVGNPREQSRQSPNIQWRPKSPMLN